MGWYQWRPYVPVAKRRANAMRQMKRLSKQGLDVQPIEIAGRRIATTFWGEAWCDHIEALGDYANRLPRGRRYVRNGSVCHLGIARGQVHAWVAGSELYEVKVRIKPLARKTWNAVKGRCAGQIGSLLELLQGRLSKNVMGVVTDRDAGLFPLPKEIGLACSCPDWAEVCKHVAAVLYGVGARLDESPELLFGLRGVDHLELLSDDAVAAATAGDNGRGKRIASDALADVFGIDLSSEPAPDPTPPKRRRKKAATQSKKTARSKRTAKRKAKPRKRPAARKPTAASRQRGGNRTSPPSSVTGTRQTPPTGQAVADLRATFGMSRNDFARLLGVSAPSVSNWENRPGPLNLQARTLAAWHAARRLTKPQAWRQLTDSA